MKKSKYPEPTVGALVYQKGKILLIQSHKWNNLWTIPGGHIESGETIERALKRELKEETNLNLKECKLVLIQDCIFSKEFHQKKHFIFLDHICQVKSVKNIKLNHEGQKYIWIKPKEALKKLKIDSFTKRLIIKHNEKTNYSRD